jgi:Family of unknown function (DUF6516)
MEMGEYIAQVKARLNESAIVVSLEVVDARILLNRGYFRARLSLSNGDFLEVAESFALQDNCRVTLDYRYQWMDGAKQILRKRWDSVKHFPDLPNFPHHVHVGDEANVEAGICLSILEFMDLVETEVTSMKTD